MQFQLQHVLHPPTQKERSHEKAEDLFIHFFFIWILRNFHFWNIRYFNGIGEIFLELDTIFGCFTYLSYFYNHFKLKFIFWVQYCFLFLFFFSNKNKIIRTNEMQSPRLIVNVLNSLYENDKKKQQMIKIRVAYSHLVASHRKIKAIKAIRTTKVKTKMRRNLRSL